MDRRGLRLGCSNLCYHYGFSLAENNLAPTKIRGHNYRSYRIGITLEY
jgi:hypothetical protein